MGDPIAIAFLMFHAKEPSTRWLALLLGLPDQADGLDPVADGYRQGLAQP